MPRAKNRVQKLLAGKITSKPKTYLVFAHITFLDSFELAANIERSGAFI